MRVLVRDPARARHLADAGIELVTGDLRSATALRELVADSAAIVHAAGAVRGNNPEAFLKTNLEGTRRMLEAAAAVAPDSRFLLLSSLAAREPQLSWYADSKRQGENLVTASELDWIVLRPPAVYGPGDREMRAIFDWMRRGLALVPGAVDARTSLLHVDDLVAATLACLDNDAASGRVFELGDGKRGGYDWAELAAVAAAVYGRPVRLLRLPAPLLDAVAGLSLAWARLSRRPAMLTPAKLRELRHPNWVTDNTELTTATGWAPAIALYDGLRALDGSAL